MARSLAFHTLILGLIGAYAGWLYVGQGPDLAWKTVGGHMATFALSAALACVLVLASSRRETADRIGHLALAALIFVNSMALTYAPLVVDGIPDFGGNLNWVGKTLALVFAMLSFLLLPASLRRESGVLSPLRSGSVAPTLIALAAFGALGVGLTFASADAGNLLEQTAFQLTLPSLSEEILFRGVLLALFLRVASGGPVLLGVSFGAPFVATSVLFGLVHGFVFAPSEGFIFDPLPVVVTGVIGLALAWLTVRSGSIWPAVIAHSLLNATGPALRLAGIV